METAAIKHNKCLSGAQQSCCHMETTSPGVLQSSEPGLRVAGKRHLNHRGDLNPLSSEYNSNSMRVLYIVHLARLQRALRL